MPYPITITLTPASTLATVNNDLKKAINKRFSEGRSEEEFDLTLEIQNAPGRYVNQTLCGQILADSEIGVNYPMSVASDVDKWGQVYKSVIGMQYPALKTKIWLEAKEHIHTLCIIGAMAPQLASILSSLSYHPATKTVIVKQLPGTSRDNHCLLLCNASLKASNVNRLQVTGDPELDLALRKDIPRLQPGASLSLEESKDEKRSNLNRSDTVVIDPADYMDDSESKDASVAAGNSSSSSSSSDAPAPDRRDSSTKKKSYVTPSPAAAAADRRDSSKKRKSDVLVPTVLADSANNTDNNAKRLRATP